MTARRLDTNYEQSFLNYDLFYIISSFLSGIWQIIVSSTCSCTFWINGIKKSQRECILNFTPQEAQDGIFKKLCCPIHSREEVHLGTASNIDSLTLSLRQVWCFCPLCIDWSTKRQQLGNLPPLCKNIVAAEHKM